MHTYYDVLYPGHTVRPLRPCALQGGYTLYCGCIFGVLGQQDAVYGSPRGRCAFALTCNFRRVFMLANTARLLSAAFANCRVECWLGLETARLAILRDCLCGLRLSDPLYPK